MLQVSDALGNVHIHHSLAYHTPAALRVVHRSTRRLKVALQHSADSGCKHNWLSVRAAPPPSRPITPLPPSHSYASDKSLTDLTVSSSSLLLANVWNLTLQYSSSAPCRDDAATIAGRPECFVLNACAAPHAPSISVGCGSLTCKGCALVTSTPRLSLCFLFLLLFDTETLLLCVSHAVAPQRSTSSLCPTSPPHTSPLPLPSLPTTSDMYIRYGFTYKATVSCN
jgi:hypothetical protein